MMHDSTEQRSSSWIHAVNDAVVGLRYPFPRKGPNPTLRIFPESSPRFRSVVSKEASD